MDPATGGEINEATLTLELKKETVKRFLQLETKFAVLISNVKSALVEKVTPMKLHSFLEVHLDQKIGPPRVRPTCSSASVSTTASSTRCSWRISLRSSLESDWSVSWMSMKVNWMTSPLPQRLTYLRWSTLTANPSLREYHWSSSSWLVVASIKRFQELVKHTCERWLHMHHLDHS